MFSLNPGKPIVIVAVMAILLMVSLLAARRPYYNWDMFPYMAIAMHDRSVPFDSTHREVYRVAKAALPPADFQAISSRQPVFMKDASAFEGILKYYTIKPGYNLVVTGLHGIGLNSVTSTWLPSVVSYFLLGAILLIWTLRTGPVFPAGLFTLVIMLSPSLIDLARYSSPDMLCAVISAMGFMLVLSKKTIPGLGSLLVAVWIRPDAAILMILVALVLSLSGTLRWSVGLMAGAMSVVSIFYIFKDQTVFYEYLMLNEVDSDRIAAYGNGIGSLLRSYTLPAMVVASALIYWRRHLKPMNVGTWLLLAAGTSLVARFALHPFIEDRLQLPAYLLILLVAWDTLVGRMYSRTHTMEQ